MSNSLIETTLVVPPKEAEVSLAPEVNTIPANARTSPWKWLAITCLLLSISGGFRFWRESQFRGMTQASAACPFPLSELPTDLGKWHAIAGSETHLDPETARVAGSSDHVIRSYTDTTTGETMSVLVIYGLAASIFAHEPELCYPAAGYAIVTKPTDHEFSLQGSASPVRYRISSYSKTFAGVARIEEVVWSFWHAGSWLPEVASRWKLFRSAPAMFKIQIQYPATRKSSDTSQGESLLKEIVRAINARLDRVNEGAVNASTKA
jgi:Protein of unknown function (DUF3485)